MEKKDNVNVDALLDDLKTSNAEAEFSSAEDFKKVFFEKAEKLPALRKRSRPWLIFKVVTALAAMLFVVVGVRQVLFDNTSEVMIPPCTMMMQSDEALSAIASDVCMSPSADGESRMESSESRALPLPPPQAPMEHKVVTMEALRSPVKMKSVLGSGRSAGVRGSLMACKAPASSSRAYDGDSFDGETVPAPKPSFNTEEYKSIAANSFLSAKEQSLSTFGADVDTASYANARRFLSQENRLPPKDAVRIEEFVNYFLYDYAAPAAGGKFGTTFEMTDCPWAKGHKLLLIGLQARKTDLAKLPRSNFVFLVDNSGSMLGSMDLVIESMTLLAKRLRKGDTVSLVTYGGGVHVLLDGAKASDGETIVSALRKLKAGGYTPGGARIVEAYKLAKKHFIKKGNNRIVLVTDGDFNVGASSESDLVAMVEEQRRSEVYLSVFGMGYGNYKDNKLKMLANKGNGNYAYLDNVREAKNAMVNEYSGGMFALARDVKFQVEFNPGKVYAYRLLGYELRKMANRDFRDDTKDAGEVGVGHQVTALYELVMADADADVKAKVLPNEQALKYQNVSSTASDDILTFRLRHREIEGDAPAAEEEFVLKSVPAASANIAWAACAAEFALLLQDSPHKGAADYDALRKRAVKLLGEDESGARAEFLTLVRTASDLK